MASPDATTLRRHAWLRANSLALTIVGIVWVGIIVHRLVLGETPSSLIVMVPVCALVRILAFVYCKLQDRLLRAKSTP